VRFAVANVVSTELAHVVAPTLAVALVWLCVAVVLAGCGYVFRGPLLLYRRPALARGLTAADLWIGLCVLIAYLQIWNLFLRISAAAWVAPISTGVIGFGWGLRDLRRTGRRPRRLSVSVVAAVVLATLWVANRVLALASDYDLGLYHLNIVHYAMSYSAIPGLANLHERLGADGPSLLFVALLSRGPWAGGGVHLANGLLAALLFVDVGSRFIFTSSSYQPSFTRRFALLLFLATVVIVAIDPGVRVGSANLDFATFVFVAVGMLYLAQSVEESFSPTPAMTSLALLVLGAVTRPLYWLTVVLVMVAIGVAAARLGGVSRRQMPRRMLPVAVLPATLAVGWAVRQALLSGYPFFPSTVIGLPVDWRVPATIVDSSNRWIASWARHPGLAPDQVLNSWSWLTEWWVPTHSYDFDLVIPLALLIVALVPLTLRYAVRESVSANETAAMLTVLVPALVTIVAWFLIAPDPRFALAPIWLVPLAAAAWTIPAAPIAEFSEESITLTLLVASVVLVCGRLSPRLIPAAALAIAAATSLARLRYRDRLAPLLARVTIFAVLFGSAGIFYSRGVFNEIVANQHGTFGAPLEPNPALVPFRTNSGLLLKRPATGFQCWRALLCTPYPDRRLRLRGSTFSDGLRVGR
jgi:hypothetical protein